ncbi:SRPBCC family protein [Micromonospora sp. NPDC023737]|uniref:SRPBCC family protein n=1 Tax=unclassified Micromonospora TaxID=2617518 RepID=UPI0033CE9B58
MIEISAQVDLFHPADRAWHALTDRELLGRWFADTTAAADAPGRLLFATAALPGFDDVVGAEVVEQRAPEMVTMRCLEAGRRSLLTCTLTPTAEGCRLSLRETLQDGEWTTELRAARAQSFQQALANRLPAILDWFAFQQVDLRRGEAGMTAELPVLEWVGATKPRGRRGAVLLAAGVGVLLAGGAAVWALGSEPPEQTGAQEPPTPTATTTGSTAASSRPTPAISSARPSRAGSPSPRPSRTPTEKPSRTPGSAPPPPQPPGPVMTARYETVNSRLLGYTGEVVVTNPGDVAGADWTVVVTFSDDSEIGKVSGADGRQDGQTVTFTGPALPAGESQTIRFDVRDSAAFAKGPASCAIDGRPCEGL